MPPGLNKRDEGWNVCAAGLWVVQPSATRLIFLIVFFLLIAPTTHAQTGKITGRVVSEKTGDPLPGVNVTVEGLLQGDFTAADGYYTILNVRPGTYDVRASSIGYTQEVTTGVRVNIDLTTTVDFRLLEETIGLDEVIVAADRPVVRRDVSASVANIDFEDVESLPITDLKDILSLQAGFENGLSIRGSVGGLSVLVDGRDMTSGRYNEPFLGISYTSIEEVQVQTAGFNAEYGNARAGLINILTQEGQRDRYAAQFLLRYAPPHQKYAPGIDLDGNEVPFPNSPGSYWTRPYFDPEVAFTGTRGGNWDPYMFDSYVNFDGWNNKALFFPRNLDNDPLNDATPEQMMEAFRWYQRKDFEIHRPDYEIDGTISGPVPGISHRFGDLRFSNSLRRTVRQYAIPQMRTGYGDIYWQGKLTTDIAKGIKLNVIGLWARQWGINRSEFGTPSLYTGERPASPWNGGGLSINDPLELFGTHAFNPIEITRGMVGLHLTHALNARTFYTMQIERMDTDSFTHTGTEKDLRDRTIQHVVPPPEDCNTCGPIELDGSPFGWEWRHETDILGVGLITGSYYTARDTSRVRRWNGRFDLTTQVNRFAQIKTGIQYIYADYDTNYGRVDPAHPYNANPRHVWQRQPVQGGLYAQTKLEFRGMVANMGVRLDYFHAGGDWYAYDRFDRAFTSSIGADHLDEALEKKPIKRQMALSPRVGVSFPITESSKFFFNYGHFRQMLVPYGIFEVGKINTGAVRSIGNPNHPMPRTIAYEVGFEQSLLDQYYLRIAGYYRDQALQLQYVNFRSSDGEVNYGVARPFSYEDHRGFEITFSKNQGKWIRGFINYTYRAGSSGLFGTSTIYENPVEMREYLRTSTEHYQSKPVPEPFASMNLEFRTPDGFGPFLSGLRPVGGWRASLLGFWRYGKPLTWNGSSLSLGDRRGSGRISSNVNWKDYWNFDLRLAKNFSFSRSRVQLFLDIFNIFNLRILYPSFSSAGDVRRYMMSLHLPERTFEQVEHEPYRFIYGKDRPGDYRKRGVRFTPIEIVDQLPASGFERPLYFVWDEKSYYWYRNGQFSPADETFVQEVLDKKAYINMPDLTNYSFLNPRTLHLGIRIDF